MSDKDLGLKTVRYFYDWSRTFHGSAFNFSFETFLTKLEASPTKLNIILDGIGTGVRAVDLSDSRIESAMRRLALSSQGRMPATYQTFFRYLSDESVQVNWMDAAAYVAKESAKDVINATAEVGKSIITTGKILNFFLPAILLLFVYFWLNNKSGDQLSKVFKK